MFSFLYPIKFNPIVGFTIIGVSMHSMFCFFVLFFFQLLNVNFLLIQRIHSYSIQSEIHWSLVRRSSFIFFFRSIYIDFRDSHHRNTETMSVLWVIWILFHLLFFYVSFKFCPAVVVALLLHTFNCWIFFVYFLAEQKTKQFENTEEESTNIQTLLRFIWKCGIFSFVSRFYITWKLWPLSLHIVFGAAADVRNTRRRRQHSNADR